MQCDWPGLAGLDCHYEPSTGVLTVKREGVELVAETTQLGATQCVFTGYLAAIHQPIG